MARAGINKNSLAAIRDQIKNADKEPDIKFSIDELAKTGTPMQTNLSRSITSVEKEAPKEDAKPESHQTQKKKPEENPQPEKKKNEAKTTTSKSKIVDMDVIGAKKPLKKNYGFRLEVEAMNKVEAYCREREISSAEFINNMIKQLFD